MDDSIVRNVSDNDGKENLIEVKDLKKHFKVSGAGSCTQWMGLTLR